MPVGSSGDSCALHHQWERTEGERKERPRANENNIWPRLVFLTKHLVVLFQRPLAHNEHELIPVKKSFWILTGKCLVLNEHTWREAFVHAVSSLAVLSLVEPSFYLLELKCNVQVSLVCFLLLFSFLIYLWCALHECLTVLSLLLCTCKGLTLLSHPFFSCWHIPRAGPCPTL